MKLVFEHRDKLSTAFYAILSPDGAQLTTLSHRAKLPFTEACLCETMRLSTLLPLGIPVSTTCDTNVGAYCVLSIVCLVYCVSCLLCVLSIVCLVYCVSCLLCVLSIVCLVYCVSCLLCVLSIVCLVYCIVSLYVDEITVLFDYNIE